MADGLNNCLEHYPEWPPGAAQFRAMCLDKFFDSDGNESGWQHRSNAYLRFSDPAHPEYEYYEQRKRLRLEDSTMKSKRRDTGRKALKNILGDL